MSHEREQLKSRLGNLLTGPAPPRTVSDLQRLKMATGQQRLQRTSSLTHAGLTHAGPSSQPLLGGLTMQASSSDLAGMGPASVPDDVQVRSGGVKEV